MRFQEYMKLIWKRLLGSFSFWLVLLSGLLAISVTVMRVDAWALWHIPTMEPGFADLRTITGGAYSVSIGLDPMVSNPGDPWNRPLNYPRIWQLLFRIGLGPEDTFVFGCTILAFFGIGLLFAFRDTPAKRIVPIMLAIFSPAVLLGVERGNIDLLMFGFVATSSVVVVRYPKASAGLLGIAAVGKLFPIFAAIGLVRHRAARSLPLLALLGFGFLAYVALTIDDLRMIHKGTPMMVECSYGVKVLALYLSLRLGLDMAISLGIAWLLAIILLGVGTLVALRHRRVGTLISDGPGVDGFRAGAGVYLGSVLLGANFDYRLVFLLLTLPLLLELGSQDGMSRIAKVTTAAVYLSLWSLPFGDLLRTMHLGSVRLPIDELASWTTFMGICYFLVLSAPNWLVGALSRKNQS